MRRVPFLHLWLCALLSLQQPSVLVQLDTWLRSPVQVDAEDAPSASVSEEAKLPGMRSGSRHRLRAEAARQWRREPPRPPAREGRRQALVPASEGGQWAAWHWRAALLPPRVPPDDEKRGRG